MWSFLFLLTLQIIQISLWAEVGLTLTEHILILRTCEKPERNFNERDRGTLRTWFQFDCWHKL